MTSSAYPILFQTSQFLKRRRVCLLQNSLAKNPWFLHNFAADGIAQSIAPINRDFGQALELFVGNGELGRILSKDGLLGADKKVRNLLEYEPAIGNITSCLNCISEIENIPLNGEKYDLILASNGLNWVNNLPVFLMQIRNSLNEGGAFFASFIGGNSLQELRQSFLAAESELSAGVAMRVSPMIELESSVKLLSKIGFKEPVSSVETLCVRYDNMFGLLRDLKAMGETAAFFEKPKPLSRKIIARAASIYQERFADNDNRIRATFDIISINGWR